MSDDAQTTISGEVTDIFAHRFMVKTASGKILADLGPKGAQRIALEIGDHVEASGEMKPSELKVGQIAKQGGAPTGIEHKKKPHDGKLEPDADAKMAIRAANEKQCLSCCFH